MMEPIKNTREKNNNNNKTKTKILDEPADPRAKDPSGGEIWAVRQQYAQTSKSGEGIN